MFQLEPIIVEKNKLNIHHMILYECRINSNKRALFDKFASKKGAQCYSKNMPQSWSSCLSITYGWAVGSEGMIDEFSYSIFLYNGC